MDKNNYKLEIQEIVEESKKKGLIKTYSEFLETKEAKVYALAEEETEYYISNHNKDIKNTRLEILCLYQITNIKMEIMEKIIVL